MVEITDLVAGASASASQQTDKSFFDRPAVFVSALSPGYIAGGSQCTLAFLQAISHLHQGKTTYVGPPFLESDLPMETGVSDKVIIGKRNVFEKVGGLLRQHHVDRCTPSATRYLQTVSDPETVIYVNGEAAGRTISAARQQGLKSVFICHNFAPEYLSAESRWFDIPRQMYVRVLIRCAYDGYRQADLRLLLTDEDRRSYAETVGDRASLTDVYFGYDAPAQQEAGGGSDASEGFTVLLNTNMALRQNEEGALFVLNEVWPRVCGNHGWKLILAGRFPPPSIYRAASGFENVEVVCHPEAKEMEQIFRKSSVCIAATNRGSGIKLRVAEALRRGLPVVSTDHCLRGYRSLSGEVVRRYETAEDLVKHLVELSQQDESDRQARCRAEYLEKLSFEAGVRKLSRIAEMI